jgi:IS1 family transposase
MDRVARMGTNMMHRIWIGRFDRKDIVMERSIRLCKVSHNEMGGPCSTHGNSNMMHRIWIGRLDRKDIVMERSIRLNLMLK